MEGSSCPVAMLGIFVFILRAIESHRRGDFLFVCLVFLVWGALWFFEVFLSLKK